MYPPELFPGLSRSLVDKKRFITPLLTLNHFENRTSIALKLPQHLRVCHIYLLVLIIQNEEYRHKLIFTPWPDILWGSGHFLEVFWLLVAITCYFWLIWMISEGVQSPCTWFSKMDVPDLAFTSQMFQINPHKNLNVMQSKVDHSTQCDSVLT